MSKFHFSVIPAQAGIQGSGIGWGVLNLHIGEQRERYLEDSID